MPFFAESWESLLAFVVILVLSGIGNWIKQRKGPPPEPWGDDEEGSPAPPLRRQPPSPQPAETPPVFDLERELRRMLGQEPGAPAPAAPPPRTEPPPVALPPPVARRSEPAVEPPPVRRGLFPGPAEELDQQETPTFELAPMAESAAAYQRGSDIDDAASAKIAAARARTDQPRSVVAGHATPRLSPEVTSVLASLREARTARQAVLAAVILGPPKSLET
jgi:hypothetical protein